LSQRENLCFKRFIDRCGAEYQDSLIGMFYNPFNEISLNLLDTMGGLEPKEKKEEVDPLILGNME